MWNENYLFFSSNLFQWICHHRIFHFANLGCFPPALHYNPGVCLPLFLNPCFKQQCYCIVSTSSRRFTECVKHCEATQTVISLLHPDWWVYFITTARVLESPQGTHTYLHDGWRFWSQQYRLFASGEKVCHFYWGVFLCCIVSPVCEQLKCE